MCLFFTLPPTPCFFSTHTATHRDRRRLVFSEHRELALSVVSCLLPSPFLRPSPGAASLLPRAAGKPAAKHCSHGTFLRPCASSLPGSTLPCPVTAWGASSSWKGRLLRFLIQQCVSFLLRSSPLPFPPPIPSCKGWGLAAVLVGILGHPYERPPVWREVARQLTGPKNSALRRQAC